MMDNLLLILRSFKVLFKVFLSIFNFLLILIFKVWKICLVECFFMFLLVIFVILINFNVVFSGFLFIIMFVIF